VRVPLQVALLGLLALGLAGPASAPAQVALPGTPEPQGATPESAQPPVSPQPATRREQLSDEKTRSQWAYVTQAVTARTQPNADAGAVRDSKGRPVTLRRRVKQTLSRELVLLLTRTESADGKVWVRVRLPMRPNNRTGWLPRSALSKFRTVRTRLVVDRRSLRAYLFRSGRVVWSSHIGIGVRRWPTPRGRFYARERLRVPPGRARQVYGPLAIGTSAHAPTLSGGNWGEGVVGVHGTGSPGLLPGRVSHGCVRVPNANIRRLWRLMPLGTPIHVR
jgi:lipoprotein-anchoring transpeptidase ErfK/SrfK